MPLNVCENMRVILLPMFCLVSTIVSSENPCESSSNKDHIVHVCEDHNTTMAATVYMYTRHVPVGAAKCFCYFATNAKKLGLRPKFTLTYVQPEMTHNLSFGVLGLPIREVNNPVVDVEVYLDRPTEVHYVSTAGHTASEKACFKIHAKVEHLMVYAQCTDWWSTAPAIPQSNHTDQTSNNATSNGTEERIHTTSTDTPPHSISDEDWVACCIIIAVVVILVLKVTRRHRNREVAQTNADPPIHQTRSPSIHHTRSPSIHQLRMPTLHADAPGHAGDPRTAYAPTPTRSPSIHQTRSPSIHQARRPTLY